MTRTSYQFVLLDGRDERRDLPGGRGRELEGVRASGSSRGAVEVEKRSRVQLQLYYIADLCRDSLVTVVEH